MIDEKRFLPKKYAIFDMDGTLFDSPQVYFRTHQQMARELTGFDYQLAHQIELMARPRAKGQSSIQIFTEIIGFPTTSNDSQAELAELEARRRATFDRILSGSEVDIIKPGVLSLLDFLDEREIPAVISTTSNRERVDRMFAAQTEIRQDNFVVIVSSDQDPEYLLTRSKNGIIKLAIQNLSCTLDQPVSSLDCMMFEDSPSGVTAARHVDVGLVVAIPDEYTKRSALTGHDFKFNQAHLVAQDFNYLQYIWTSV